MYLYLKEKKYLIISIISIILDGVLLYFMPSYFHNINYFYPMLTISLIPFLYYDNIKDYYQYIFIMGIIYDLLYSNLFLFNSLIFLLLSKIDIKILKLMKNNLFIYLMLVVINIILYDLVLFILVSISYHYFSFNEYFYKISKSILLNVFISLIYYLLIKKTTYPKIHNNIHQK